MADGKDENGTTKTSDRLLEVAARDFRRYGYAGMSMRELADALGIQKASLYHHIKSKDELLYRICMGSLDSVMESVQAACAEAPEDQRLEAAIRLHCQVVLPNRDIHAVMLAEMRSLKPEHFSIVRKRRSVYAALIEGLIEDRQKRGQIRSDIPAKMLALSLFNLLNWTIFWYQSEGPWSPEEISAWLIDIFLQGANTP